MSVEETIRDELIRRFPFMEGSVRVARARRIFADVPREIFAEVFRTIVHDMGFAILCTISGLDDGEQLSAVYHLAQERGIVLSLKTSVPKSQPLIHSVTNEFPAADCYERELADLLGFQVLGLPAGHRYPLPDGWPEGQYPLRKDWKPARSGAEVK
jgi:Ni,Fe-hydrogenase III component G